MARPVDALDRAIIKRLQVDGRMSSAEIARQLGVAERTVRARIDRPRPEPSDAARHTTTLWRLR